MPTANFSRCALTTAPTWARTPAHSGIHRHAQPHGHDRRRVSYPALRARGSRSQRSARSRTRRGRPIAYAIERLVDYAAHEHGFDPSAAARNFIPPEAMP
jgi:hypothetical protein